MPADYFSSYNDLFIVAESDRLIAGGVGHDVAVFSGTRSDYTLKAMPRNVWEVTGPDGQHDLFGVETYRFADGDYEWDFVTRELAPPREAATGTFRLFTSDYFVGSIGGKGSIFGTNGFQRVGIFQGKNQISFDSSFNRGNDEIIMPLTTIGFTAHLSGSNGIFSDTVSTISVPFSQVGPTIWHGDNKFGIYYSDQWRGPQIAGYPLTEDPQPVPGTDTPQAPQELPLQGSARAFLSDGAETVFGGNYAIFGTNADQHVVWRSGNIVLDPSFARGGDLLTVDLSVQLISAQVSNSNLVLTYGQSYSATIPIGEKGMEIAFISENSFGNDIRVLSYDPSLKVVLLGGQNIPTDGRVAIAPAYSATEFVTDTFAFG